MEVGNCPPVATATVSDDENSPRSAGRLQLLAAFVLIATVWLVVLPQLARHPSVQEKIERNERLGIDPSATYYTEIEAMDGIIERMQSLNRHQPDLLWSTQSPDTP